MRFWRLFKFGQGKQKQEHDEKKECPSHVIVKRSDIWYIPQLQHVLDRIHELAVEVRRHEFPPWMANIVLQLAELNDADAIIKEAMMVEAMAFDLVSEYDASSWNEADMQAGGCKPVEDEALSREMARYIVVSAIMVRCAEYTDDRDYHFTETHSDGNSDGSLDDTEVLKTHDENDRGTDNEGHAIALEFHPSLVFRRDPTLNRDLVRLFAVNLSTTAARNAMAMARAAIITYRRGPQRYGDVKRLLSAAYGPHSVDETAPQLSILLAWVAYSAIRDGELKTPKSDSNTESDVLRRVARRHALLADDDEPLARCIAQSLAAHAAYMAQVTPGTCLVPAGISVTAADAFRPSFSRSTHPLPSVAWSACNINLVNMRGWFGPIRDIRDLDAAIAALRTARRPKLDMEAIRQYPERAARFAVSYKHEIYNAWWRMSPSRTVAFRHLAFDVVSVMTKRDHDVYLWLDRVFELDITHQSRNESAVDLHALRAATLETFATVPVLFLEKDLRSDAGSFWLWAERLAATLGVGCFGKWLPLVASMDGNIHTTFGRIADTLSTHLHYIISDEECSETGDTHQSVLSRLACILLRSNVNSKGVHDILDFNSVITWAEQHIDPQENRRNECDAFGTEQDWMGACLPSGITNPVTALNKVNVLRCGQKINEAMEEIKVHCHVAESGIMGTLTTRDNRKVFADVIFANGSMSVSCVAPDGRILRDTFKVISNADNDDNRTWERVVVRGPVPQDVSDQSLSFDA